MYWYFDNQLKIALAELISAGGLAFLDYAAEQLVKNTEPVPQQNPGEWIESKVGANATDYEVADDFRDETATSFKKHGGRMDQVLRDLEKEAETISKRRFFKHRYDPTKNIPGESYPNRAVVMFIPEDNVVYFKNSSFRQSIRSIALRTRTFLRVIPVRGLKPNK